MTGGIQSSGFVLKRDLSHGAVAGTVVGVVVAVALLAFCLYPVIVHQIKRRRGTKRPLCDAEAGGPEQQPAGLAAAGPEAHRRLSSTDSFKQQDGELSRGDFGGARSKEAGWTSRDGNVSQLDGRHGPSTQYVMATEGGSGHDGATPAGHPFSDDYVEYMPTSMLEGGDTGAPKGANADYYSPSIPSEAFGMVTTPDTTAAPAPTFTRGSSFKKNIKEMFRRQSGHESSLASVISMENQATSSRAVPGDEPAPKITTGHPTDSPTALSPTNITAALPPVPALMRTSATDPTAYQPALTTPPQSPLPERAFKASPPPPSCPAPGTVNPMDIMPASTESEVWHRTEHQLSVSSHGPSPGVSPSSDRADEEHFSTFTPPATTDQQPVHEMHTAQWINASHGLQGPQAMDLDAPVFDYHGHDHLDPSMIPDNSRHPSYPSDQSTPYPGPHSTGPSTENTPSTQIDSPSPASVNSSDFRHSASPQPPGFTSPKMGLYRCDEVDCNQVFDQPHKLKHHQRYHTKDHKCPYKNCGKGFGTKTHLQRHINDRHEKKKKFHCAVPGCDYSKTGGKAFPRKDNWKRHMTKIHNINQQDLPEPIEIDEDMGGT